LLFEMPAPRVTAVLTSARLSPHTRSLPAPPLIVSAPDLAASIGRDRDSFKLDVRKLKALGLTESLEIGYRLSPRGLAYLGIETEAANGRWSEPVEPPNTEARETPTPGETST